MTRTEVTPALLADVKNYLNITWEDQATDDKVRGLIASGTVYLNGKEAGTLDYETDGEPRTLLFEYVRYMRDEALDVFENNYRSRIVALRNESLVNAYVESTEPTKS
jgi:hypothetical protein